MSETEKKLLDTEQFYADVKEKIKEGMEYRDAVQLCAVMREGEMVRLISAAINKYQEAIYVKTELFQQANVDECALASMGKLWHGETFEGSSEQMTCTEEEVFLDSLYLALKYAKSQNSLEEVLVVNELLCGDKKARRAILKMAFDEK